MNLPPPPQGDDPIITQFKPVDGQWELNDENTTRIDPGSGQTILHNYCKYMDSTPLVVYRHLIEVKGCDINVHDNNNDTPIHLALCCFNPNNGGDKTVLTYLLAQNDINIHIKNNSGSMLLHIACQFINYLPLDIFKVLIETHGGDVNAQDDENDTPLHRAIDFFDANDGGDITVLTYLMNQKNINVNIKGQYGYTLFQRACDMINKLTIDVFKALIETQGCDVNVQDKDNDTPIHLALRNFNPDEGGDINVLAYLINQKDVNVNIKGEHGRTLLHYACYHIDDFPLDIFKTLIETHGGDVNAQDDENDTPLHYAFRHFDPNNVNNITVFAYLINQNNFNLNIKDEHGYTSLHLACTSGISDSEDDFSDPDDDGNVRKAKSDTVLSQIVEIVAERCIQEIVDESSS
jgi:ankyrin repeat protein